MTQTSFDVPVEIFVDMENVHPPLEHLRLFSGIDNVRFHFLYNKNFHDEETYAPLLSSFLPQTKWYRLNRSGKSCLDIMLGCLVGITSLGYDRDPVNIYVISKDTGYDEMCLHLANIGVEVNILPPLKWGASDRTSMRRSS